MPHAQLIQGRYSIIDEAGSGGYATVFHAVDTNLKRDVAIKRIELSEDEVARARLLALEARMANALDEEESGEAPFAPFDERSDTEGRASASALDYVDSWDVDSLEAQKERDEAESFPQDPAFLSTREEYLSARSRKRPERCAEPEAFVEDANDGADVSQPSLDARSFNVDHLKGVRGVTHVMDSTRPRRHRSTFGFMRSNDIVETAQASADAGTPADMDELESDDLFEHIPGLQEARSVAQLNDSHIVTVYDCFVEGSCAYIVMEYVEGKTLAEIIDEANDDITLDIIAAAVDAVSHALQEAHDASILHLDVKPENVIVNEKGVAKVTDFGLSALMDASGVGTTGGGTIGYMPLEQMRRESLDVRTDEWALASLTYEMLTGSNPFFAPDLKTAEQAIEDAELVLPSLCWDELDEEIDDVVFAALDPEMDERFDSVSAFAKAISPFLGNPEKGQREMARMVSGAGLTQEQPPLEVSAPPRQKRKLVDRLGRVGGSALGRILSALAVAMLTALGLMNIQVDAGSLYGLATDSAIVFWAVVGVCAVLAAIWPVVGTVAACTVMVVALIWNGALLPALVLATACGLWTYFLGRRGVSRAAVFLVQPLFGAFGLAEMSAVLAGVFLGVRESALSVVLSFALALVMASLGSFDVMNWDILSNFTFAENPQANFFSLLVEPRIWILGVSWIVAAVVYSVFCLRGTKPFDIAGSICSAVLLVAGVIGAAAVTNFGGSWLPQPMALLGALVPGIVGVCAAVMEIPDRARWAKEEWDKQ